jgi:hypothetical protein
LKRPVSILLLFLLLYNSGGYVLAYFNIKEVVKEYSMYCLSRSGDYNSHSLLKISKTEIQNKDVFKRVESKEFRYNNKMYDIAKEIDKGDTVYFYCIEDKNEVILDELFAGCFQKEDNGKSSTQDTKIILRFLITEAVNAVTSITLQLPEKEIHYTFFDKKRSSFVGNIITPPPRLSLTI